ncbi:MAG: shikimate dehydrogenase [Glaciecola sp.]|jgi:shikimate dehydrogenase
MTKQLGLIGYPLGHSFSAGHFKEKFSKENITGFEYLNFEIDDIKLLPEVIKNNVELIGLNVTIPYKEAVIPYLDKLDDSAKNVGAVNTIKIDRNGGKTTLTGYNTDTYGFRESLKPSLAMHHQKALILGTGGAAKAAEHVLKDIGLEVLFVSRNPEKENEVSYDSLNETAVTNFPLIVNSSPIGMHPNIDKCPDIPYEYLSDKNLLFDLIYNPEETLFLKKGKEKGALTQNGLPMLILQAEKAWEIWNR